MCPHAPEVDGPCPCRKPGLQLFRQAAAELGLDLARSIWIGDRMSDIEPAHALGGRGVLVLSGEGAAHRAAADGAGFESAPTLAAAVSVLVGRGA
jgi:D-glycero-D-manno-heptose 1,7-bisphosphate phosphatase